MVGEKKTRKIVVYFGCSMHGGYALVSSEDIAGFPKLIRNLGYRLASDHQTAARGPGARSEIRARLYSRQRLSVAARFGRWSVRNQQSKPRRG